MASVETLKIGASVRYRFPDGRIGDGVVMGRRMNGQTQGRVDPDDYPHAPSTGPDWVKVAFPRTGWPPETPIRFS